MLNINTQGYNSPDSTYFRTSDAEPELERDEQGNQILKLVNGTGTRRSSWGEPGVHSSVILDTENLVAIHVGFFHKHGGSQFWRYYRYDGQRWKQVTWAPLSDEDRERVLIACEDRAPAWAKTPGKLRTSYIKPTSNQHTTYKIVEVVDGRYYSVFDGKTEYIMGRRLAERAVSEHGGGYYSYPTVDGVEARFNEGSLFPRRCYDDPMALALIECEISGTILEYDTGKFASTYLRFVRVLKQFNYTPAIRKAC